MSRMLTTYVCAYKSSGQLALKQGHLSMVPLTQGHLPYIYKLNLGLVKGWPYKKWATCIQFTKHNFYHSTGMGIRSNSQKLRGRGRQREREERGSRERE